MQVSHGERATFKEARQVQTWSRWGTGCEDRDWRRDSIPCLSGVRLQNEEPILLRQEWPFWMHLGTFIYYVFASLHMVNADAEKTVLLKCHLDCDRHRRGHERRMKSSLKRITSSPPLMRCTECTYATRKRANLGWHSAILLHYQFYSYKSTMGNTD